MPRRETARAIDAAAARWAARLDRGDLTADEARRFDAWFAQDLRRLGAVIRLLAVLAP